jgi:hypothetical protein
VGCCARRQRPSSRAAKRCEKFALSQLIEWHSVTRQPVSQLQDTELAEMNHRIGMSFHNPTVGFCCAATMSVGGHVPPISVDFSAL